MGILLTCINFPNPLCLRLHQSAIRHTNKQTEKCPFYKTSDLAMEVSDPLFMSRYKKLCKLGEGTYGVVFKARDIKTQQVAPCIAIE